jgi:hypothetical protein
LLILSAGEEVAMRTFGTAAIRQLQATGMSGTSITRGLNSATAAGTAGGKLPLYIPSPVFQRVLG